MPALAAANFSQREIGAEEISDFEFGPIGLSISGSIGVPILNLAVKSLEGSQRIFIFRGREIQEALDLDREISTGTANGVAGTERIPLNIVAKYTLFVSFYFKRYEIEQARLKIR